MSGDQSTEAVDDRDTLIEELRESNKVATNALKAFSAMSGRLVEDMPKDEVVELRRPEDILYDDDKFETIQEKWAHILKRGGMQLYNVSMKPWIARAKSNHSLIISGLTAAEISYYHHMYDSKEDIARGSTQAIFEVIEVSGMVCDVSREELYNSLRSVKTMGRHIYDQSVVDRLFPDVKRIPMTVKELAKSLPQPVDAKGVFKIGVDKTVERILVDKVVKLASGGMLSIKYYEDVSTQTSSAGVLWRRTGISGG